MKKNLHLIGLFLLITQMGFAQTGVWVAQATKLPTNWAFRSVDILNDDIVWCPSYNITATSVASRVFCKTNNGGTTWIKDTVSGSNGQSVGNFAFIDENKVFALLFPNSGTGGRLMQTLDAGYSWTQVTSASYNASQSFANIVHVFDANNIMTMGDPRDGYFEIYHSNNGGTSFTRVPQANIAPLLNNDEFGLTNTFDGIGDKHLWFGTSTDRIYRTSDGGQTYEAYRVSNIDGAWISEITFADTLVGICNVTDGSTINYGSYKTSDGGKTWSLLVNAGDSYGSFINSVRGFAYEACSNSFWVFSANSNSGAAKSTDLVAWETVDSSSVMLDGDFGSTNGYVSSLSDGPSGTMGAYKWTCTTTGVNNNLNQDEAISKGYPNPVKSIYRYESPYLKHANVILTIYDLTGKQLQQNVYNDINGYIVEDFNFTNFPNGIYLLNVNINNKQFSQKIIKD